MPEKRQLRGPYQDGEGYVVDNDLLNNKFRHHDLFENAFNNAYQINNSAMQQRLGSMGSWHSPITAMPNFSNEGLANVWATTSMFINMTDQQQPVLNPDPILAISVKCQAKANTYIYDRETIRGGTFADAVTERGTATSNVRSRQQHSCTLKEYGKAIEMNRSLLQFNNGVDFYRYYKEDAMVVMGQLFETHKKVCYETILKGDGGVKFETMLYRYSQSITSDMTAQEKYEEIERITAQMSFAFQKVDDAPLNAVLDAIQMHDICSKTGKWVMIIPNGVRQLHELQEVNLPQIEVKEQGGNMSMTKTIKPVEYITDQFSMEKVKENIGVNARLKMLGPDMMVGVAYPPKKVGVAQMNNRAIEQSYLYCKKSRCVVYPLDFSVLGADADKYAYQIPNWHNNTYTSVTLNDAQTVFDTTANETAKRFLYVRETLTKGECAILADISDNYEAQTEPAIARPSRFELDQWESGEFNRQYKQQFREYMGCFIPKPENVIIMPIMKLIDATNKNVVMKQFRPEKKKCNAGFIAYDDNSDSVKAFNEIKGRISVPLLTEAEFTKSGDITVPIYVDNFDPTKTIKKYTGKDTVNYKTKPVQAEIGTTELLRLDTQMSKRITTNQMHFSKLDQPEYSTRIRFSLGTYK